MDLGFGNKNQAVGNIASATILKTAQAREQAIDAEISKYDELLNYNDDALEALRAKRLDQMKAAARKRQIYIENGHGTYVSLGEGKLGSDLAREFFEASKASERLVVHFYRPTTRLCDVFHSHLQTLAPKHLETRFVKINVEDTENSGVSFLVERLGIAIMPTLLIVKDRKAHHQIRGFDELGGNENFSTTLLACILASHGAIHLTEDERDVSEQILDKSLDD
jgi:hypothetical protein